MKIPRPKLDRYSVATWSVLIFMIVIVHQTKYQGWLGGVGLAATLVVLALNGYVQGVLTERYRPGGTADVHQHMGYVTGYFHAHAEVSQVLIDFGRRVEAGEEVSGNDVREALARTIDVRLSHDERFSHVEKVAPEEAGDA